MKVSLVQIGNSRGIRLPKTVLDQCGFEDAVEMTVDRGRVVLSRSSKPRAAWKEAFAATDTSLNAEDREWIEASLSSDDD